MEPKNQKLTLEPKTPKASAKPKQAEANDLKIDTWKEEKYFRDKR